MLLVLAGILTLVAVAGVSVGIVVLWQSFGGGGADPPIPGRGEHSPDVANPYGGGDLGDGEGDGGSGPH